MTEASAKFVGSIPEHYDRGLGPNLFAFYADDIARRMGGLGGDRWLELAAGTGIVTKALQSYLGTDAKLVATDLNQPMLDVAAGKVDGTSWVEFQTADALELPFADNSFDAVLCQFGVMFFPDKLKSYQEARRVLRPDGSYIFNVWASWEENPFAQLAHETIAAFYGDNPPMFYQVPFGYHDVATIEGTLLEAGFESVDIETVSHIVALDDIPTFAEALVRGNPISAEIQERGGDPAEVVAAMEKALLDAFGQTRTMPLKAIVFTANK